MENSLTGALASDASVKPSPNFFDVIEKRRSIRRYKDVDVSDDDISLMIKAAQLAPSTNNSQPWQFLVVKAPDTIRLLSKVAGGQRFIEHANTVVMALANRSTSCCPNNPSQWHVLDTMIATEHLVLAATTLGYGSCWIAMLDSRNTQNTQLVKSALRIPDDVDIVALVALGIPDEVPEPRDLKHLEQIAFSEVYGRSRNQ